MESNEVWPLTLLLLSLGITAACVLVGRRLRKLGLTLLIAVSVWAAVWLIGYVVANADWGNDHLSGWADCHNSCDVWDGVGAWLIFGPPIAAVVAVLTAAVVAAIEGLRSEVVCEDEGDDLQWPEATLVTSGVEEYEELAEESA